VAVDGAEVPWWSSYVAVLALAVSIGFNLWQLWDRRRERKPDVTVTASNMLPGSPSWPLTREGQYSGAESTAVYLAAKVHVTGTVTIAAAGMAPPSNLRGRPKWWTRRRWVPLTDVHAHQTEEGQTDRYATLPQPVSNGDLYLRVETTRPLPSGITQDSGARLWVRTSNGYWFVSEAVAAPLGERYRGPK
jgi:3',5'-cyclic AMP phosphodiesterase CpdA